MVSATQSDLNNNNNNEDARSTSSTLVSGEHASSSRNDVDVPERHNSTVVHEDEDENITHIRHGFDQELYEEDIIRFLYFSEKRHDSNAKPNTVARNALKDWVCIILLLWNLLY
jgi:regulator-associated protein of mTOR